MLEMPTIDKTEEWEDQLDREDGTVKFPVTLFDTLEIHEIESSLPNVVIGSPKLKKNSIKEINLGNKSKKKGNELF